MSRPINPADKPRHSQTVQSPSERVVFVAGIVAAAVIGVVIVFVHPG